MKFIVYCTLQHIEKISATETHVGIPHDSVYHKIEASNIFEAMAKLAKDEKSLIKANEKHGWKVTYTSNGYISECGSFKTIASNFRLIAEGEPS